MGGSTVSVSAAKKRRVRGAGDGSGRRDADSLMTRGVGDATLSWFYRRRKERRRKREEKEKKIWVHRLEVQNQGSTIPPSALLHARNTEQEVRTGPLSSRVSHPKSRVCFICAAHCVQEREKRERVREQKRASAEVPPGLLTEERRLDSS